MPYLTNETIFDLAERPDHLLVLGGGPIGMEMAQAHRRLGCEVTVIEADRALGREDPEAAALVLDGAAGEGVRIVEDTRRSRRARPTAAAIALDTDGGRDHRLAPAGGHRARAQRRGARASSAAGIETTAAGIDGRRAAAHAPTGGSMPSAM